MQLGKERINCERGAKYRVLPKEAPEKRAYGKTTRISLIHEDLTVLDPQRYFQRILLRPDWPVDAVPAEFFPRLRKAAGIPMLEEWADWLWNEGQQPIETIRDFSTQDDCYLYTSTGVEITQGEGCQMASITASKELWTQILRRHHGLLIPIVEDISSHIWYEAADPKSGWRLQPTSNYRQYTVYRFGEPVRDPVSNTIIEGWDVGGAIAQVMRLGYGLTRE